MSKNDSTTITLLAHAKISVFEWGKTVIDIFSKQAIKNKYVPNIAYEVNEINDFTSPIVILGVDSVWLDEVIEALISKNAKIILIFGLAHKNYEYVSHVTIDMAVTTKRSLNLLYKNGRTSTAFFGAQKNDSSDRQKALSFVEHFMPQDVYAIDDSVENSFSELMKNIDRYDSIICANDVMAIYLIARFRELGIDIPERLQIIGNGNLWLGAHVTPTLTTVSYNHEVVVRLAIKIFETLKKFEDLGSINSNISADIIERGSSGAEYDPELDEGRTDRKGRNAPEPDTALISKDISGIVTLNAVLTSLSENQISILRMWLEDESIDIISEKLFIVPDTVKYHLKNIYKSLGIHSKQELFDLANKYGLKL